MENQNPIRDAELYYITIYGKPSADKTWGWRFEGHHLSLNFTLVNGKHLALTPNFYGGNPATVEKGKFQGLQVLGKEENLARELIKSFNSTQKEKAVILKKAPKDIFSKSESKVERSFFDISKGIPFKELNPSQQQKLLELVKVYTERFRPDLLNALNDTPQSEKDTMVFAWAGGFEKNQGHYYRIVTTNHLIEYDNVQKNAGHPHCVWREFDGDFGEDLLLKHHREHH